MTLISFPSRLAEQARAMPDAAAVTCGSETITRRELCSASRRLARELAGLGVGHGDIVTVALPNSVDWFVACCACWNLGATPQHVSPAVVGDELDTIVRTSGSTLVLGAHADSADRLSASVHHLPIGHRTGDEFSDAPLPDAISPAWRATAIDAEHGSRGSTRLGDPAVLETDTRLPLVDRADGCAVIPGPLHQDWAATWSCRALLNGNHVVTLAQFDAEATLRMIETHRADTAYVEPAMMERILRLDDDARSGFDLTSLRALWHVGEPCPPQLQDAYVNWLGPHRVLGMYPGKDARAGTIITGIEWAKRRRSVGRVAFGQMIACDADGTELPTGAAGFIWTRSMLGGDWHPLGDTGWFDGEGYLHLDEPGVAREAPDEQRMPTRSVIDLRCIADTGTFARYVPFADDRQIVVRRGAKLGHDYGLQDGDERYVTVSGMEVPVTRHRDILSPPVMGSDDTPMTPEAIRRYQPDFDVLRLPDAEVLIPREPDGFDDAEVDRILAAISLA